MNRAKNMKMKEKNRLKIKIRKKKKARGNGMHRSIVVILVTLMLFNLAHSGLFTVTVEIHAETVELQAGDVSLVVENLLKNVTVYEVVGNGSLSSLSASSNSFVLRASLQKRVLLHLDAVKVVAGTSESALAAHFYESVLAATTAETGEKTQGTAATADMEVPVIYPLRSSGYQKLAALGVSLAQGVHLKQLRRLLFPVASDSGMSLLQSNGTQNLNLTANDFKKTGVDSVAEEKFRTGDVLTAAEERLNLNLSTVQFDGEIDPQFTDFLIDSGLGTADSLDTPVQDVIRTEAIVSETTKNQKYDVLLSGFDNYEEEAVITPVKDHVVKIFEANNSVIDPNTLLGEYDSLEEATATVTESPTFKQVITEPIVEEQNKDSGSNQPFSWVTVRLFGLFPMLRIQSTAALPKVRPLLRLSSFTAVRQGRTRIFRGIGDLSTYKPISRLTPLLTKGRVLDKTSAAIKAAMTLGKDGVPTFSVPSRHTYKITSAVRHNTDTKTKQAVQGPAGEVNSVKQKSIFSILSQNATSIAIAAGIGTVMLIGMYVLYRRLKSGGMVKNT